jgi:hypothetical protein
MPGVAVRLRLGKSDGARRCEVCFVAEDKDGGIAAPRTTRVQ